VNISAQFQQIGILLHNNRLISSLEKMTTPIVFSVHIDCVAGVDILHNLGNIREWCLQYQVIVIVHEDIRMKEVTEPFLCPAKDLQESFSV